MVIEVRGKLERRDLYLAQRLFLQSKLLWALFAFGALSLLSGVVTLSQGLPLGMAGILLGLLWVSWPWLVPWLGARKMSQQNPHLCDIELRFDEEAFSTKGPFGQAKILWTGLVKWREDPNCFLLYPQGNVAHIVPKRFFASPADEEDARRLIAAKVLKKG